MVSSAKLAQLRERLGHRRMPRIIPRSSGYRRCPVETGCTSVEPWEAQLAALPAAAVARWKEQGNRATSAPFGHDGVETWSAARHAEQTRGAFRKQKAG